MFLPCKKIFPQRLSGRHREGIKNATLSGGVMLVCHARLRRTIEGKKWGGQLRHKCPAQLKRTRRDQIQVKTRLFESPRAHYPAKTRGFLMQRFFYFGQFDFFSYELPTLKSGIPKRFLTFLLKSGQFVPNCPNKCPTPIKHAWVFFRRSKSAHAIVCRSMIADVRLTERTPNQMPPTGRTSSRQHRTLSA